MNSATATTSPSGTKRSRRVSSLEGDENVARSRPSVIITSQTKNSKRLKMAPTSEESIMGNAPQSSSPAQNSLQQQPSQPSQMMTRRVSDLSSLQLEIDSNDSESEVELKPSATSPTSHIITPASSTALLQISSSNSSLDEQSDEKTSDHQTTASLKDDPRIGLSLEEDSTEAAVETNNNASAKLAEQQQSSLPTTSKHNNKHISWKFVVEMLVIQWFVWLAATVHYQTSNRMELPVRTDRVVDLTSPNATAITTAPNDNCIYVPGGGFSGFWFSLGRLQSLSAQEMQQETFVCYSAGCLGVVATLLQHLQSEIADIKGNVGIESTSPAGHQYLYDMARSIQVDWLEGRIHRYEVVENFIDGILESLVSIQQDPDRQVQALYDRFFSILSTNVHITTTMPTDQALPHRPLGASLQAALRSPTDEASLKTMLLQTTWIPVAIGSSFSHQGHLDGAFSAFQHPSCRRHVGLVVPKKEDGTYAELFAGTFKLFSNTLNVNLGKQAVEDLWQMGLDYGV